MSIIPDPVRPPVASARHAHDPTGYSSNPRPEEAVMDNQPDSTTPAEAARPAQTEVGADRPRRIPVAALLNTGALLATTALLIVTEPKSPPFRGD
jgi:hypothetical protein